MVRPFAAPIAGVLCLTVAAGLCAARIDHSSSQLAPPGSVLSDPRALGAPVTSASADGVWTDHFIVKVRVGVTTDQLERVVATSIPPEFKAALRPLIDPPPLNAARAAKFGLDRFYVVDVVPESDTVALAAAVSAAVDVIELAEADPVGVFHSTPSDPAFAQQWSLNNEGQSIAGFPGRPDADIDWVEAWQLPHPSVPVIIGLADTGVSQSHPDLQGQTVPGRCFICPAGSEANTDDVSTTSHGTYCSGIIAARTDNAAGMSGVTGAAPATKIMPLKISNWLLNSQPGNANAMIWAADHGVSIVSMSLGFASTANLAVFREAANYAVDAGLLLVASTGNTPHVPVYQPASWPDVLAVGATNNRDELWPGTTTGPELDVVAPGDNIWTTMDQSGFVNGYGYQTGTSMACPMVAAVASLVWAANPALTAGDVRHIIENSVDDLGTPGWDSTYGHGRLNANRALTMSIGTLPQCQVDFNEDGVADIGDLFVFLSIYFSTFGETGPGLRADFDQSGTVSVDDMFAFMAAWFGGC